LRVLGLSVKDTLLPSQTCVDRGASARVLGTVNVREQDGQKSLKVKAIAANHARGGELYLSQVWRWLCISPSSSQLASIHGD
jgi:hypothetical protein